MSLALPEFRLEVYLGRWESAARHHLTASDAQTLSVGELLGLGTEEQRADFARLPLTYTPTWGTAPLLEAVAGTYDQVEPEHVLTFAALQELVVLAGPVAPPSGRTVVDLTGVGVQDAAAAQLAMQALAVGTARR